MATIQREDTSIATDVRLERLRRLARWLDSGIRVPGTQFRIGLDPILGLVPGVGDAAGAIMACAILVEAVRRGVPRYLLIGMATNIAIDATIGAIPVAGDVFDMAWKANERNFSLLERHIAEPSGAVRSGRHVVLAVGGVLFVLGAALVVGSAFVAAMLLAHLVPAVR